MAIFGTVIESSNENEIENEFEGKFKLVGEEDELDTISLEAATDLYRIQAGMYVSDIMMEAAIMEGASEEVLMENFAKDIFDKLIETFKKLWAKIKEWFNQAIKSIQILFMSGEKFIKKFEREITSKDSSKYSYKGYKWNKTIVNALNDMKNQNKVGVPVFSSVKGAISSIGITATDGKVNGEAVTKFKEQLLKGLFGTNTDNISEYKKEVMEKATGGEKEEIERFSVYSLSDMISHIKDSKKTINKLNKAQSIIKKNCDNVIKGLENLRKELKNPADKAKYSSTITNLSSINRFFMSVLLADVEMATTINRMQQREFESALKGLLRYKGAKEGFDYDSSDESSSILEAAMQMI